MSMVLITYNSTSDYDYSFSVDGGPGNCGEQANGKDISDIPFQTEWSSPGGSLQFKNGCFGKLQFHLTFNVNFRIFG